ncbi:MAG: DEAD/DEAH box helicase [Patescibacteria group bacterium]|nr:DEAD/DEAH box helicase [Patescibacteria group bacterium]
MTFKDLDLNLELTKSLDDLEFLSPTPIQEEAIKFLLKSKKDLVALAQTGTGKTAAFALPILNQIKIGEKDLLSIILCPTRELCLQISQDIKKYAKYSRGVKVVPVYGGEKIDIQIRGLKRGTNIVVGTPGRVHDLIRRKILKLQNIKWLVLDEADEMLDMGFKDDLDAILGQTPKSRQTLLFSATISKSVRSIARQYMKDAEEVKVGESNVGAEMVSHEYYVMGARDRFEVLKRVLDFLPGVYGILFCRTRRETQDIADKLKQAQYDTEALHGEISQSNRTKIMGRFKKKQIRLLVATDVAARGIDVNNLSHVINYNLPDQNESYTHRSGRTGRAENHGISILLITPRELRKVKELERMIGKKFEYKKIPNQKDIYQKQIENLLLKIEKFDFEEFYDGEQFTKIADKLKKINKDDLINYFIADKFSHLSSSGKNVRDLNASTKVRERKVMDRDSVNIKINFGKKQGFDVKKVFALINSNKKLRGLEIGKINLMPEHFIFSVEKRRVNETVRVLSGSSFHGKKIIASESKENVGYYKRSSYQGKKKVYQGKKKYKSKKLFKK